jgi:regulator of sirC expression with transglutaminase-like and TPR domain
MLNEPVLCRPQAFYFFAEQVPQIDTTEGLLKAAIAVSMHALDDVRPDAVLDRLRRLSQRVRRRVRGRQAQALLAHLHDVLFEEEGFGGNSRDYFNPLNCYLPAILVTHRGIPITLTLIYKAVAEGVGLEIEGVNAPGHFLARVKTDEGRMIIDPFFEGSLLTPKEAFDRVEQVTGRPTPRQPQYLDAATHSQWISRLLLNLQHMFASTERRNDSAAMAELQSLLDYSLY